jgi:hypothetical protein
MEKFNVLLHQISRDLNSSYLEDPVHIGFGEKPQGYNNK